jgi:hypothetical protein
LWDFCWGPNKGLMFTCLFVFQCDHNEYSKIQCTLVCGHLHIGVMMMVLHHHLMVWSGEKNKIQGMCGAHDDICIRGYIHLLRDSLRQTSSFPLPSA